MHTLLGPALAFVFFHERGETLTITPVPAPLPENDAVWFKQLASLGDVKGFPTQKTNPDADWDSPFRSDIKVAPSLFQQLSYAEGTHSIRGRIR